MQTVVSTEAVVEMGMGMGMVVMPNVKVTEEFVCLGLYLDSACML